MRLSNSRRVWTTSSAAADGVEARTSATKSAMVKSVSWPTPEITGISEAKIARATISSLKDHKSSMEPPPRARISASTNFPLLKNFSALTISSAEPSPGTRTGKTVRCTLGKRLFARGIEKAFGFEALFQLLASKLQRTLPHQFDVLDVNLILAALPVNA